MALSLALVLGRSSWPKWSPCPQVRRRTLQMPGPLPVLECPLIDSIDRTDSAEGTKFADRSSSNAGCQRKPTMCFLRSLLHTSLSDLSSTVRPLTDTAFALAGSGLLPDGGRTEPLRLRFDPAWWRSRGSRLHGCRPAQPSWGRRRAWKQRALCFPHYSTVITA